jgi:hypothetical protein
VAPDKPIEQRRFPALAPTSATIGTRLYALCGAIAGFTDSDSCFSEVIAANQSPVGQPQLWFRWAADKAKTTNAGVQGESTAHKTRALIRQRRHLNPQHTFGVRQWSLKSPE